MNRDRGIKILAIISALATSLFSNAETENKLSVVPSGRVLIDGGVYFGEDKKFFKDGMAISEARLGAKLQYGKWSSWIDVGFAYGKIGLRNMWVQYDFNNQNSLRIGNFLQPFGLQSNVTTSLKVTYEQPLASALYTPGIQLGAMYTFYSSTFYSSSAFHVESSALTEVMNYPLFNKQGFTILTRDVWRTPDSKSAGDLIIHGGVSFGVSTPQRRLEDGYDIHDGFSNSAYFPTKVTTLQAIGATVGNAKSLFKMTPEFLFGKGKIAVEAQYFLQNIFREKGYKNYLSQSGYVTLRGLITGGDYSYDYANAQLVYPKKNALEWVVDYNYANLSDSRAGVWGGRANSFNVTLNYYFNQYFTARLNYSYTHVWDRLNFEPLTQNVIQARIMVLF